MRVTNESRTVTIAAAVCALAAAWAPAQIPRASVAGPPELPREMRGAWIATVANIDWPSRPGLPSDRQRAELETLLDRASAVGLNAVILQVRPQCDALYPSPLEPWSEYLTGRQGRPPEPVWDPLAFAVEAAHARGLELHAWFNPYRARHAKAESPPDRDHVSRRIPQAVVEYADQLWLDPGHPRAREHTLAVIEDVVRRYDVDGVHIDDYFYPYPVGGKDFPDYSTYRHYRRGGGRLGRGDWRRANVDQMVEAIHRTVRGTKPWVKFGISPFGIARPGVPEGIEAGIDQHEELYADVRKWLRERWCDYLAPQLYWRITQWEQSYPVLLEWWADETDKAGRVRLWPGNFTSRAGSSWPVGELLDQVELTREEQGASGNIHFSMRALLGEVGDALRQGPYARPALVPSFPWLDDEAPQAPSVRAERGSRVLAVRWEADDDVRWWLLWGRSLAGSWRLLRRLPGSQNAIDLDLDRHPVADIALVAVDRAGNESRAAMTSP